MILDGLTIRIEAPGIGFVDAIGDEIDAHTAPVEANVDAFIDQVREYVEELGRTWAFGTVLGEAIVVEVERGVD